MNLLSKMPKCVGRFAGKMMLKLKNASPELCIIGGIMCGAGAIVTVGVVTWKRKEDLSEDAASIRSITKQLVEVDAETEQTLTKKEQKKLIVNCEDQKFIYRKVAKNELSDEQKKALMARRIDFTKDILKTYWLPVTLEVVSICLIWRGRTKLRARLSEMAALYAMAMENYKKLYERIKQEYGEEKAQELAYGVKMADSIDSETGEAGKVPIFDKTGMTSMYAFMYDEGEFDEESGQWIWKNNEYSPHKTSAYLNVKNAENEGTRILIDHGWYLLADLKKKLGVKPGPYDYRVGWWYKPDQENRVELGVFDDRYQLPFNKGFADPHNPQNVCLINPNVDGIIDFVFEDIERYDFRCGKRLGKKKRMPTNAEMFGEEYAKKLQLC